MLTEAQIALAEFDNLFPVSALQHADDATESTLSPWPGILTKVLEKLKPNEPGSATLRGAYLSSYKAHAPATLPESSQYIDRSLKKHFSDIHALHKTYLCTTRRDNAIAFVRNEPQNITPTIFATTYLQNAYEQEKDRVVNAATAGEVELHVGSLYAIVVSWQATAFHELGHLLLRFASFLCGCYLSLTH
jgi:hypothetical protein